MFDCPGAGFVRDFSEYSLGLVPFSGGPWNRWRPFHGLVLYSSLATC